MTDVYSQTVVIRDEATGPAQRARRRLQQFQQNAKFNNIRRDLHGLGPFAQNFSRELQTASELVGADAQYASGGFVASMAAMGASFLDFSRRSRATRIQAQMLDLTAKEYLQFSAAAKAAGVPEEKVESGLSSFGRAIIDLRRLGQGSGTFERIDALLPNQFGLDLASEFQRVAQSHSTQDTMLYILRRMKNYEGDENATSWFRSVVMRAFGIESTTWMYAADEHKRFGNVVVANEENTSALIMELVILDAQIQHFQIRMAEALLPTFAKLVTYLAESLAGDTGDKLRKILTGAGEALLRIPWDKVRDGVEASLGAVGREVKAIVHDVLGLVIEIDKILAYLRENQWRAQQEFNRPLALTWNPAQTMRTMGPFGQAAGAVYDLWRWWSGTEKQDRHQWVPGVPPPDTVPPSPLPSAPPLAPDFLQEPPQQHGLLQEKKQARIELTRVTKDFTSELFALNDAMRIQRAGAGGGNVEGGVTRMGRNRPMRTKAGGVGGTPLSQASGSALTQLGIQRGKIFTYKQIQDNPEIVKEFDVSPKTALALTQESGYEGFHLPGTPVIAYDPNAPTGELVKLHEAGHLGREIVERTAKSDPNIFTRYAFRDVPAKTDLEKEEQLLNTRIYGEIRQRMTDLSVSETLRKAGLISANYAAATRKSSSEWFENQSSEFLTELARHEAMAEMYARKMQLNVTIKAPRGIADVSLGGDEGVNPTLTKEYVTPTTVVQ